MLELIGVVFVVMVILAALVLVAGIATMSADADRRMQQMTDEAFKEFEQSQWKRYLEKNNRKVS